MKDPFKMLNVVRMGWDQLLSCLSLTEVVAKIYLGPML